MTYVDSIVLETNTPKETTSENKTNETRLHILTILKYNDIHCDMTLHRILRVMPLLLLILMMPSMMLLILLIIFVFLFSFYWTIYEELLSVIKWQLVRNFFEFSFILLFEEYFQFTRWHFNVCNSDHPCCSYLPHLRPLPPSHPLTRPHPIFVSFILRSMTSSRIPHSQVHVDIISWTKWVIKKGRET